MEDVSDRFYLQSSFMFFNMYISTFAFYLGSETRKK